MFAASPFNPNTIAMFLRRFLVCLLIGLGALATAAQAQVKASLVAADTSIQPGKAITVALRLEHQPHWHTYWLNPGTGLATALNWKLPAGWTASDIRWPAPKLLKDRTGGIIGNGYEDDLLLPVTLTPPANLTPGETITLNVHAEWLMCEDVCMPGEAELSLNLPVSAGPASPDATFGPRLNAVVAGLPRALDPWKVSASKTGDKITLVVTPVGPAAHKPAQLHFFADDNLVAYDKPQTVKEDGQGGYVLTLAVSPDLPADTAQLAGVLISNNGWLTDGALRGLRVDVPFTAAAGNAPANASGVSAPAPASLIGTLLLAFLGGLILNLMPCVFPVLGIKILGFVNQAGHERSKVIAHGLVFTLGVLLSFWTLATVLAVLRAGGDQLGWGFQLQSPAFVFSLAALMLIFALNMSGLFEFGLRATGVGSNLQSKSGLSGSFFTGVLATIVATPCSAPFLAPALGAALALPVIQSFAIFTAIAVGLSMPYLLLSIFPQAVKILPRPGAWMETFKQFMAFPLYATVGYLVWVLAGQATESGLLMALFGLVLIALAVWIYGRWTAPGASSGRVRFGVLAGLVVFALGAWTGWPKPAAPTDLVWETWSHEAVEKARSEGKIVYVDFTARWCATCQTNKKLVFGSSDVLAAFRDKKVVALKGDWTNKDPKITEELAKYQRSAIPFNVIWFPGKTDPVILPEILTAGTVLDALKKG